MKMKRLFFILAIFLSPVLSFAQDSKSAAEVKNAGNEALRAKNYKGALEMYEKYLGSGEEGVATDSKTIYNMATCARKLKIYDKALKFLNKTKDLGYKADAATFYIGSVYKSKGDDAKAKEVFEKALVDYPSSRYLPNFKKQVTTYMNKDAADIFNEANTIAGKASGKPAAEYLEIMKGAVAKFNEAKSAFKKVLEIDANNKVAVASMRNIDAAVKAYEDYKTSLNN